MSQNAPAPKAGWYLDPDGANTQRYWDGSTWTDQLAPMTESTASPQKPARSDAVFALRLVAGIVSAVLALDLFGVIHLF